MTSPSKLHSSVESDFSTDAYDNDNASLEVILSEDTVISNVEPCGYENPNEPTVHTITIVPQGPPSNEQHYSEIAETETN